MGAASSTKHAGGRYSARCVQRYTVKRCGKSISLVWTPVCGFLWMRKWVQRGEVIWTQALSSHPPSIPSSVTKKFSYSWVSRESRCVSKHKQTHKQTFSVLQSPLVKVSLECTWSNQNDGLSHPNCFCNMLQHLYHLISTFRWTRWIIAIVVRVENFLKPMTCDTANSSNPYNGHRKKHDFYPPSLKRKLKWRVVR